MRRTTVPFLYNFEDVVDGLSVIDFPGVDDRDKTVAKITEILLQLSQLIILVIDYRFGACLAACLHAFFKIYNSIRMQARYNRFKASII